MRAWPRIVALVVGCCLVAFGTAHAQQPEWRILDNSFLVEEAFNQERGVFQNIFTWARARDGGWAGSFTQEWPAPGIRHQLSYTIPFSRDGGVGGVNDVLLNYRFQLIAGEQGGVAISPRLSLILPTGDDEKGLGAGTPGLQLNLPASRQFGDLYVHANAGYTWIKDVERTTALAASGIWQATPMFHLMLEAIGVFDDGFTLSPGFRRGWGDERQIVFGLALPVTWSGGTSDVAVLTYFSYELPFRRLH